MPDNWVEFDGLVHRGHQIASGRSPDSPYPAGSLDLQSPHFKEHGLDLDSFYPGTVNISIRPYSFKPTNPQFTFRQVHWTPFHPPEDFSFSRCRLVFDDVTYAGWLYYPHPETKKDHFQDPSIVEVIAPYIQGLNYGDPIEVWLNREEISVTLSG